MKLLPVFPSQAILPSVPLCRVFLHEVLLAPLSPWQTPKNYLLEGIHSDPNRTAGWCPTVNKHRVLRSHSSLEQKEGERLKDSECLWEYTMIISLISCLSLGLALSTTSWGER